MVVHLEMIDPEFGTKVMVNMQDKVDMADKKMAPDVIDEIDITHLTIDTLLSKDE